MSRRKPQAKQVRYVTVDEVPSGYAQVCQITPVANAQKCISAAVGRGYLPAVVIGVGGGGLRRGSVFVHQEQAKAYLERFYRPRSARHGARPAPAAPPAAPAEQVTEAVAAGQEELVAVMRELVDVAGRLLAAVKPVAAAPHIRPAVRTLFGEPAELPG